MVMDDVVLEQAFAELRLARGDSLHLEAKQMSRFSADALGPTMCAFANLPGGGTLLLGVDESQPQLVVGVDSPHQLAQQVTELARSKAFSRPLEVVTGVRWYDGRAIVLVEVREAAVNEKPVFFRGEAYVRMYDGDYTMSPQEQQQLLRRHERPRDDRVPVVGTSRDDLDPELVASFLNSVRVSTPFLSNAEGEEILRRLNVLAPSGEVTVAGLYALGTYPQQFLPHVSLTAARIDGGPERATNRMDFTGPISAILEGAVEWVRRNADYAWTVDESGRSGTRPEFPEEAVREIVANALVHRDLSDAASGKVVELRITHDALVLTNPGGLWGVTPDQLGTPDGKSAVNEFLYEMCRHVPGNGERVIEGLASGIARTRELLGEAGRRDPEFVDNGLRFTVRFPRTRGSSEGAEWLARRGFARLSEIQQKVLLAVREKGEISNADYRELTGANEAAARRELAALVSKGLLERRGERRGTRYRLREASVAPSVD